MKSIKIKAVAVGVLADILLTLFFMALIMILISIVLYGEGVQGDALIQNTLKIMHSTKFLAGFMIIGSFMDFVAGLVTGKLAKTSEVTNAGLAGAISLIIGLAIPSSTPSTFPSWFHWTGVLVTIPAFIVGGIASVKLQNSPFLSLNLKEKFLILKCIEIFCLYEAIMLIAWSYLARKDIISSVIEALLWTSLAVGLINKLNIARRAIIVWFVFEIVLEVPYRLAHMKGIHLDTVSSIIFYISIRVFVIYYLRKKSIVQKFEHNICEAIAEQG
jgi:hypothetical protein